MSQSELIYGTGLQEEQLYMLVYNHPNQPGNGKSEWRKLEPQLAPKKIRVVLRKTWDLATKSAGSQAFLEFDSSMGRRRGHSRLGAG